MTKKQLIESAITKIVKKVMNEQFTEKDLKFVDGKAIVKSGRKIVGKVFDKQTFYQSKNIPKTYDEKYPYSLEIPSMGQRNCESIDDVLTMLNKYAKSDSRVGVYSIG